MNIRTIAWEKKAIRIIDQTALPHRLVFRRIRDIRRLWRAIRLLEVRGAPALGAAAALGVYLGVHKSRASHFQAFRKELEGAIAYLSTARPTARNLFWALESMRDTVKRNRQLPVAALKRLLLRRALQIIEDDRISCRRIGVFGSELLKNNDTVLTVCNAGILATIDYGTALGIVYRARQQRKNIRVFACETRPLLQGARLTAWELASRNVPVTLLCDNMAASLMQQKKVSCVIVGADRVAANGDTANKIGTLMLAVLCRHYRIPFYVACPCSTIDTSLRAGSAIPIEQRPAEEVTAMFFKKPVLGRLARVLNPAFDVTPAALITAIVTDRGIVRPPFARGLARASGISSRAVRDTRRAK